MKNLKLLTWVTQLGLSVALPPVCVIPLTAWLHNSRGWGMWIVWLGIAVSILFAADGLRTALKAMNKMAKDDGERERPVSFNDHD